MVYRVAREDEGGREPTKGTNKKEIQVSHCGAFLLTTTGSLAFVCFCGATFLFSVIVLRSCSIVLLFNDTGSIVS